ncbi:MAG TPA: DNA repair protein RecN [Gemmatimonadaceae bacterium]|nr:DNA repair protein RecN [Gemmatimonadaceae bacterium]
MLTELRIRNFAIIESLTLPLAPGLNVLTGETGAGKSIIVGALGLLLGERASADLIRTGADKALVEGIFHAADRADVRELLDERGIDLEDQMVVLRREITAAGRTRAWINDVSATAGLLADVGRRLVNLHGQHEAQTLLDHESQRRILDEFGGGVEQAARVAAAHAELARVTARIETLRTRRAEAERRADYLRHVAEEIEAARLVPGEEARLEEEARRLEHAEELRSLAASLVAGIEGGDDDAGVLHALGAMQRTLAAIIRIDPSLTAMQESFDAGYYAIEALGRDIEAYLRSVDLDPERLDDVRRRRDLLFRLGKKYGPTLADVIETGRSARAELELIDTADLDLRALETERQRAADTFAAEAAALSTLRTAAAEQLGGAVGRLLPALGMPDGRLSVTLLPRDAIAVTGAEDVEFRVTLNVGHEARALDRVASGGELSRVMLALQTILARLERVPTLVFDEVDAGIGGRVALQVGDTMRAVAAHHQVLAITHLPQIAARAHHHVVVSKAARGGLTTADTHVVRDAERVVEIARMLGGDPDSDVSRAHARELLESAGESRPTTRGRRTPAARHASGAP